MQLKIKKDNQDKLKWLWKDENTCEWIGTFIKIADKDGQIVPFILTDEQREVVTAMQRQNIILKSRQLGISVVVVALSIRACIVQDNTTCLLVSHSQDSTNTIFDKLKQQYNSLPEWLKPKTITNNRQELKFTNNSKITCVTAGNKDIGRGDTINGIIHLSEFSFWKEPEKQLKALSQALSQSGKLIIESTANGFNKFSEMYYQSKNNENSYQEFFFNWINGGRLFEKLYQLSVDKYVHKYGHELLQEELTEEELGLQKLGCSMAQLTWRREKIATEGIDTFHQEYPATDDESFLVTGSTVFDSNRVNNVLQTLYSEKQAFIPKDKIIALGLPNELRNLYPKSLHIWEIPKKGEHYYIGIDCSEGLKQDYSTAIILNSKGEQCGEFANNQLKPYQLADVFDTLGRYYNKALLTVEKASGGHSVIERLRQEKQYRNMTKYVTYDEHNKKVTNVGFDTNAKSKSIIINDCREWFERGLILLRSRELLEEMKVFVANENGSMGAISGSHDDRVIGLSLAIQGIKERKWYLWN